MATSIDICNLALDNLGVSTKIATLEEDSKEARACKRWYSIVRDAVLGACPWPFAAREAELVESETETSLKWTLVYVEPTDLLKTRRVFAEGAPRNQVERVPYARFLNAAKTAYVIGCDEAGIRLEYTAKFDTEQLIALAPASFVDALAWKLAARLVTPLAVEAGKVKEADEMYTATVAQAFADVGGEQEFDQQPEADYIEVRG